MRFLNRSSVRRLRLLTPLAFIGLWACLSPPVAVPNTVVTQETQIREAQNAKNKVDILFMIDNSPSMAPKQAELKNRFPQLIKILDNFAKPPPDGMGSPAWYHIGVVTSDLGSGMYNLGGGQCHPGGDGAKLQAIGKAGSLPGGGICGALGGGVNFIDYNQLAGTNNLPAGQDLPTTFNCMASVGDTGCGFESQLESVFAALKGVDVMGQPIPENHDFLRDDAILAVVWVTDEDDDCSTPYNTDLFDPNAMQYGALLSYRGTNYGIMCDGKLPPYAASGGPLNNCVAATTAAGGKCYEVTRYTNFFSLPKAQGGVKIDPNDVILATISGPPAPVEIILANPNPQPPGPYQTCTGAVDGKTCAVVLQHSCIAASNTSFFGDPAVRLSQVVQSAKHSKLTSICDTSYQQSLQDIGTLIVSQLGNGCLNSPLAKTAAGGYDCVVEDHTVNANGTNTISEIAACPTGTVCDAMNTHPATSCWCIATKPNCPPVKDPAGGPAQQIGVTILRPPAGPPPSTTATINCSTIAQ